MKEEPEKIELEEVAQWIHSAFQRIDPGFLKFLKICTGLMAFTLLVISFFRETYTARIAHMNCNKAIVGLFNKSLTSDGWKCFQNGELVHTPGIAPETIPSPAMMIALYALLIIGFILYRRKLGDNL